MGDYYCVFCMAHLQTDNGQYPKCLVLEHLREGVSSNHCVNCSSLFSTGHQTQILRCRAPINKTQTVDAFTHMVYTVHYPEFAKKKVLSLIFNQLQIQIHCLL